jgi:hypothetical protein
MSDGGKGSSRRPQAVPDQQVAENWARIFARNPDNTGVNHSEYPELVSPASGFTESHDPSQ